MSNPITTSFIPKQTLNTRISERREPMSLITATGFFLLILSLIYFAGVFAYRYMVYNEIYRPCGEGTQSCGLKESLNRVQGNFQFEDLARLKRLDTKLKAGASVLASHETLMPLFNKLSQITANGVQFTKFEFDKTGVILDGLASSYEDVAFQNQVLADEIARPAKERVITAFDFSDFDLDKKGSVIFKLKLSVNSNLLLSFVKNNS